MDDVTYIRNTVSREAVECEVLRPDDQRTYGNDMTVVDTVDVVIFAPTTSSTVNVEGTGQDASFTGLLNPIYENESLTEVVNVGDVLDPTSSARRYEVRTKYADPEPSDPEVWVLGLDRANSPA